MGHRRRGTLVILCVGVLLAFAVYGRAGTVQPLVPDANRALGLAGRGGRPAEADDRAEVSILGPWSGADVDCFWAVAQPFAQRQGLKLSFESTPDVPAVLAARVAAGTPPDVAILPGVRLVREYAQAGKLVPLRRVLDAEQLEREYPAGWAEAVSVGGEAYGAYYRAANKSLVWYNPAEFRQRKWTVPLTWDELIDLGERIVGRGLTPWSVGLQCGAADGEPGTDWIENIMLRSAGAGAYDRWVNHEIAWTDEAVRQAFLLWGQIVGRPRNLYGGPPAALQTDWLEAADALYQDVPEAYLYMEGSFIQPLIANRFPKQAVEKDYDCFPLPAMSLQSEVPVLADADTVVLFRQTPQSEALLRYLIGDEAKAIWLQCGGYVAPSAKPDLDAYPDPLSRRAARQLVQAETVRFDASEQMPEPVADAFRQAVREFVANPGRLDAILAEVEEVATKAYAGTATEASSQARAEEAEPAAWLGSGATDVRSPSAGTASLRVATGLDATTRRPIAPAGESEGEMQHQQPHWAGEQSGFRLPRQPSEHETVCGRPWWRPRLEPDR